MRTECNKDGSYNVWMSRDEHHEIPRASETFQQQVAIRLMGDCGLRVAEVLDVEPGHITRKKDGRSWELGVVAGKDTTGEYDQGRQRETWLPTELEGLINRYCQENDVDDSDRLVQKSKRTVQYWVEQAADRAAKETADRDYQRVSTHDLRRCWANHLLIEENISPRIVMALGGWSTYDAIEPYLAAPIEDNIIKSMATVEL